MKHIIVVGGHSKSEADADELAQFCDGVRNAYEAEVGMVHIDQLQFVIAPHIFKVLNSLDGESLGTADLVILRSKMRTYNTVAYCLSRYCTTQGVPFFNDYSGYFPGTKVAQAAVFYEQKVPFLKTLFAMDPIALTTIIQKELQPPFILKDALGAKGEANYLIHSFEELRIRLAEAPDTAFIAQEFCPNDRDYRVLVMGEGQMIFKRQGSADTHLNNTSKGALATLASEDLPPEIIGQAHDLATTMGLQMAGIDVMPRLGSPQFYFIETNSQPQLFTGVLQDEKQRHFGALLQKLLG